MSESKTGYTFTVNQYESTRGYQLWDFEVIDAAGDVVAYDDDIATQEQATAFAELAIRRLTSPLYRDPSDTTRGDW